MGNKRQSFVNFPHLKKDGYEGSLPLCPPQSLKIPPFFFFGLKQQKCILPF